MTKNFKLELTGGFSVSAQTCLKRYSERLLLCKLSSSLSRIDNVYVNLGAKKKQESAFLHCTPRRLLILTQ